MPRIRTLKPECWQDPGLGTVTRDARLLFVGLITQADDAGRLNAAPALLRSQIFPFDYELPLTNVAGWLDELEQVNLIVRYEHDGRAYVSLKSWTRHQKINRATQSRLPAPPRQKRSLNLHGGLTEDSVQGSDLGGDQGEERIGEDQRGVEQLPTEVGGDDVDVVRDDADTPANMERVTAWIGAKNLRRVDAA